MCQKNCNSLFLFSICEVFDNVISNLDYLSSALCWIYIMINICCVTVLMNSVFVCHKAMFSILWLTIQVKMLIINLMDSFWNFIVFFRHYLNKSVLDLVMVLSLYGVVNCKMFVSISTKCHPCGINKTKSVVINNDLIKHSVNYHHKVETILFL